MTIFLLNLFVKSCMFFEEKKRFYRNIRILHSIFIGKILKIEHGVFGQKCSISSRVASSHLARDALQPGEDLLEKSGFLSLQWPNRRLVADRILHGLYTYLCVYVYIIS